jgi:hypothetical protein
MKINAIGYALMILVLIICIKIYRDSDEFNLKCIVSDKDGMKYCVRERSKITLAADRLADVNTKMQKLVEYCKNKYPNRDNIKRLVSGFNPKKIIETLPTSEFTAYTENKGEKIAFCLNSEKNSDHLIDPNTLTFVAIHELSHIASKDIGHESQEFWQNFKFLLEQAKDINIIELVDYKKQPKRYCGMTISDNPYYDL